MPGRTAIPWTNILLESGLVVLGVVLALAANEWRQGRADRNAGLMAAQSITEELDLNRESVYRSLRYHVQVSDSIHAFDERDPSAGETPGLETFSRGFISPASGALLSTAWDVASTTGALNHIPYPDVLAMSRVYDRQEAYREQAHTAGQLIYDRIFEGGTDAVVANYRNLASVLQTFIYAECNLLAEYDEAIAATDYGDGPAERPTVQRCRYYAVDRPSIDQ